MAMTLFIESLDTLFFRDHRPFVAGEDTYAESTLPSPLTIYGAIGDYYLKSIGKGMEEFKNSSNSKLGTYDKDLKQSNLKIKGIFLTKEKKLYLPTPANLYGYGNKNKPNIKILLPGGNLTNKKGDIDDKNVQPICIPDIKGLKQIGGFIESADIKNYFLNNKKDLRPIIYYNNDFFAFENRYGNMLSRDSVTVEHLYSASHLRFEEEMRGNDYTKAGVAVLIEGLDKNDFPNPTLSIGGERKRALIIADDNDRIISPFKNNTVLDKIKISKKFFIYLVTPSIFKFKDNGWYWSQLPREFSGAKFIGAAINKPVYVSGWMRDSYAKGVPRPLKKAVPAGSVYFFTADNWNNSQFRDLYENYNINESLSEEYSVAGFGISIIGAWD